LFRSVIERLNAVAISKQRAGHQIKRAIGRAMRTLKPDRQSMGGRAIVMLVDQPLNFIELRINKDLKGRAAASRRLCCNVLPLTVAQLQYLWRRSDTERCGNKNRANQRREDPSHDRGL